MVTHKLLPDRTAVYNHLRQVHDFDLSDDSWSTLTLYSTEELRNLHADYHDEEGV